MSRPGLEIQMRAPVDDDLYLAAIQAYTNDGIGDWAELYLENADESAMGHARVVDARVIVRVWLGDSHLDVPYEEAVSTLERARQQLLDDESRVPPTPD